MTIGQFQTMLAPAEQVATGTAALAGASVNLLLPAPETFFGRILAEGQHATTLVNQTLAAAAAVPVTGQAGHELTAVTAAATGTVGEVPRPRPRPRSVARAQINGVVARIKADWWKYDLQVEIDNRKLINYAAQQRPFLQVQVLNLAGGQLDLGDDPFSLQEGQILLAAVVRAGDGTAEAVELLEFAENYFHMKDFDLVRCHAAVAVRGKQVNEWWYETSIIPFWYQWK